MGVIEISDKTASGVLAFDLAELLDVLGPVGQTLWWGILELNATGDLGATNILDLEGEIARSRNGLIVSWEELRKLGHSVSQVVDGVFVGCRDSRDIPELRPGVNIYAPSEVVLEAIDSSLWRVFSKDGAILDRFRSAFVNVEECSLPT